MIAPDFRSGSTARPATASAGSQGVPRAPCRLRELARRLFLLTLVLAPGILGGGCGGGGVSPEVVGGTGPSTEQRFDSSFYRPVDLEREAQEVYGESAHAVAIGDHLWDWRAQVGQKQQPLDVAHAVATQYGAGWTVVSVGVGKNDWRAVRFGQLTYVVLPVMEIASDKWLDIQAVLSGLSNYRTVLTATQNWYQAQVGTTFRLLQPLVLYTDKTATEWNAISASTEVPADEDGNYPPDSPRWNLINEVLSHYDMNLPMPGSTLAIAAAPYTGNSPDVWLGAADVAQFAVAPPRATSVTCPATGPQDTRCADAEYAIGHELGHAFGLQHSDDAYPLDPLRGNSIMQAAKPWDAILLSGEIAFLASSPFFQ